MTDRNKPGAALWGTTALLAALLVYPVSFGPACWASSRLKAGTRAVTVVYQPIAWCLDDNYEGTLDGAIRWYAGLGAPNADWGWWARNPCHVHAEPWAWTQLSSSP